MIARPPSIWLPSLAALVLAAMWVQSAISLRTRQRVLTELARQWGLLPQGDCLPTGMTLDGTGLRRWTKVRNAYAGVVNGREVAFFDCTIDWGRGRWSRTVVSARGDEPIRFSTGTDPTLVMERAGEWMAIYHPRDTFNINGRFMPAEKIEGVLRSLTEQPSM